MSSQKKKLSNYVFFVGNLEPNCERKLHWCKYIYTVSSTVLISHTSRLLQMTIVDDRRGETDTDIVVSSSFALYFRPELAHFSRAKDVVFIEAIR